jgi:hypothetical protein
METAMTEQKHTELLPCPHCGVRLEKNDKFSSRSQTTYSHPESDPACICGMILVSTRDPERVEAWNRRTPIAAGGGEATQVKLIATKFFRWWWNQPGANTDQGYDEWAETEGAPLLAALSTAGAKAPARDFWLQYDHQVGQWCVENEPPKVTRSGAEVIHTREIR